MIDVTMATLFLSFIDMIIMPGIAFCVCVAGVFFGNYLFYKKYPSECTTCLHLLSISNTHIDQKLRELQNELHRLSMEVKPIIMIYRKEIDVMKNAYNDNVIKTSKRRGRKKGSKNKV